VRHHVRILALCLIAALTACIMASPALAKKSAEAAEFEKFEECPFGSTGTVNGEVQPIELCSFGEAGPESFFQAGKVTIHFVKPILLKGGVSEGLGPEERNGWIGARLGDNISKEKEPAPSLTEALDVEALPAAEKERYEKYIAKGGTTKVTETIELAKPASEIFFSFHKLLGEDGKSFGFPVMVHIENKFLGQKCYDGNTVDPIEVAYTTGTTNPPPPNVPISGRLGNLSEEPFEVIGAVNTDLVNNEYAVPGVTGCGVSGGADGAVNQGLGLPSPAGTNTTELKGQLWVSDVTIAEEHIHF
jgi:hypothetical protein